MKLTSRLQSLTALLAFLLFMLFSATSQAVPRELWNKPVGAVTDASCAMQVHADGTGGVGVVYWHGNISKPEGGYEPTRYTAVWYNISGRELWRKTFEVPEDQNNDVTSDLRIVAANRYALVVQFFVQIANNTPDNKTTVISRSGAETDADEVNMIEGLSGGMGERKNVYSDLSGFFGFRLSADNTLSIIRHSFR